MNTIRLATRKSPLALFQAELVATRLRAAHSDIAVEQEEGNLLVKRPSDQKRHKALHGLYRALINNMVVGVTTGYSTIRTLSDASVRNCKGDMAEFRPTLLAGVPAVWETLRKGILGKVSQSGAIRQALFNGAYAAKKYNIPILKQLAEAVVFSKINAGTAAIFAKFPIGVAMGCAVWPSPLSVATPDR